MSTRRGAIPSIALLVGGIALAGCSSSPTRTQEYLLAPPPPHAGSQRDPPHLPPLRVKPLVARGFLDREAIAWREGDVRSGVYEYRRWSELPAESVTRELVDLLRARGAFAQVDRAASRPIGALTLSGELLGLNELSDERGEDPQGVAELELVLEIAPDDPTLPVSRRIFHARREVAAGDESMEALVRAISRALAQALEELAPQIEGAAGA